MPVTQIFVIRINSNFPHNINYTGSTHVFTVININILSLLFICIVVELGLTATALPIQISLEPSEIQFGKCLEGVLNSQKMTIRNDSDTLPLTYRLSVPAHYKIDHNKGHILPEKEQSLVVIFQPKQLGDLNGYLSLEIIGEHIDGAALVFAVYRVPMMGSCIIDSQRGKRESKTQKLILADLAASIRPHDRKVEIK